MSATTETKKIDGALPTHDPSAALDPTQVDANKVASDWLGAFAQRTGSGDTEGVLELIWEEGFWRDLLPLTWSFRSLGGKDGGKARIREVLNERLKVAKFSKFEIDQTLPPHVQNMFPDLSFVQILFTFETAAGNGSGVARLIPPPAGKTLWQAFTISTVLEGLHGVNEMIGAHRQKIDHTGTESWLDQRAAELEYTNRSPEVLIIGAGQSGLDVAARLKFYGVDALCVDKFERVGDNWRKRYKALRLHDPVWYDHMPYLPFPPSWPVYTPSSKLADWLENYAHSLELNVWTSTNITSTVFDESKKEWTVELEREGTKRTLKPKIVVWAAGIGGGEPLMPKGVENADKFKGTIVHSSGFGSGKEWKGKNVVVVGACTSAHDISKDLVDQGAGSTTMIQRSPTYIMSVEKGMPLMMEPLYCEGGPPVDLADRLAQSFGNCVMKELHKRVAAAIKEADKDLLDGLEKKGFRTHQGEDDSGFLMMAWARAGGYYLDVGCSQYIIDGKIKLHSGHGVKGYTEDSVVLEDGTKIPADLVIYATGWGDNRTALRKALGDKVADQLSLLWGLNYEREINGCWTSCGHENLYVFAGNLALCRFNSKLVALQIKAQLNGTFKGNADRCDLKLGA